MDPSNEDRIHRRNWVRLDALPALCEGARRDLVPVLNRQAAVLRAEADLLDELADALLAEAGGEEPSVRALAGAHPGAGPSSRAALARSATAVARGGRARPRRGAVRAQGRASSRGGAASGGRPGCCIRRYRGAVTDPVLGKVVVPAEELRERIVGLGKEITADYAGRPPLLVGVLKGAFMFMSDLARAIDLPGRVRLHGGVVVRVRDAHERRRADHQGPGPGPD